MPKAYSITVKVNGIEHTVHLPGVSDADYRRITDTLRTLLGQNKKTRIAIADAFELAVDPCPSANRSDLWHHVLYRTYPSVSTPQSWVRTSGEGFELFLCCYYNRLLASRGLELTPLFNRNARKAALVAMGISAGMGSAKLDVSVLAAEDTGEKSIIGGVHVKASLAERISDDAPVSKEMIRRGFWSPLCTLDVKTYPPRDLTNRGELGTPEKPSDKRRYLEDEGLFSACYSNNQRTVPSGDRTSSGRKIYRLTLQKAWDQFCADAVAERDRHFRER